MMQIRKSYDFFKRGFDIIGAGAGLVVLAPVLGATALLVRIRLGSPVMFRQERPGQHGKIFKLYKFRSMLEVDPVNGLVMDRDRLTPFGTKLRATSLDELPSLLNVLRGDMSIVGPRPLLVEYLGHYSPLQSRRHEVKPGITGLAQVQGRNAITWDEKFLLDVQYVDSRSMLLDVKILWDTVRTVLARDGISHTGEATMNKFEGGSEFN